MKARHGLIVAVLALAGCGPGAQQGGAPAATSQYPAAEAGFDGPPRATSLTLSEGGALALSGLASPNAEVRLATPQGRAFTAVADDEGAWRLALPRLEEPAMFGLSSRHEGRTVQAEGYIALLPAPGPTAVLLRAAAGASPIRPTPTVLTIAAVDGDAAGAAVVSGAGQAGTMFNAHVDGVAAGESMASESGRFTIALTRPLVGGQHVIDVRQANTAAVAQARLDAAPPQAPEGAPYTARRIEGGWRLDWMTPGGGLQTTVVFDRVGAGA